MYEHSALAEAWEAMIVEILYRQGVDTLCILTTEQSMSDYLCTKFARPVYQIRAPREFGTQVV